MKRTICILLVMILVFGTCAGCGKKDKKEADTKKQNKVEAETDDTALEEVDEDKKHQDTEHVYKANTIEPTCTTNGSKTYICELCNHSYTETLNALGHSWSNATCTAPKKCTKCGVTEGSALGHTWKSATCITPKTCSVCGVTEGTTTQHSDNGSGNCSVCGAYMYTSLEYVLAACAYRDMYNNAKFPMTIEVYKVVYYANGTGGNSTEPCAAIIATAENSLGGKGYLYSLAYKSNSAKEYFNNTYMDNSYYVNMRTTSSNPLGTGGAKLDICTNYRELDVNKMLEIYQNMNFGF